VKARPGNIERLLNGYIDDELSVRQQTEVKRLLGNNPKIARRLRQLQKCKTLISSLPAVEAPPEMVEDVMARLARRSLLGEETAAINERAGTRDLFLRKVLTAAAMIALLGVLALVVYTIVAPPRQQRVPKPPIVAGEDVIEPPRIMLAKFNGRLELKTADFKEMDAFMDRAVAENGLVRCAGIERLGDKTTYVLTVETDIFDAPVAVDAVTTDQITEITTQTTSQDTVRVAKDLALLNDVTEQLRTRAVLLASGPDRIGVDRPVITGRETIEKTTVDKPNVELVIILTRSN